MTTTEYAIQDGAMFVRSVRPATNRRQFATPIWTDDPNQAKTWKTRDGAETYLARPMFDTAATVVECAR